MARFDRNDRRQSKAFAPYKRAGEPKEESETTLARKLHEKLAEYERTYEEAAAKNDEPYLQLIATAQHHRFSEVKELHERWDKANDKKAEAFVDRYNDIQRKLDEKRYTSQESQANNAASPPEARHTQPRVSPTIAGHLDTLGNQVPTNSAQQVVPYPTVWPQLDDQRLQWQASVEKHHQALAQKNRHAEASLAQKREELQQQSKALKQKQQFEADQKNWHASTQSNTSGEVGSEVTVHEQEEDGGDTCINKLWSDNGMCE